MSRKNHKIIDGKLLQTDKKYANLKMKQKERINLWVTEEIHSFYKEYHKMPARENEFSEVLDLVYKRIEEADIWIPYEEIYNRYMGSRMNRINKIYGQIQKEERMLAVSQVQIEALPVALSVCKVSDYSQVDLNTELCFTAKTEEENSLVYPTSKLPDNILDKEDGWQAMRIMGILDFSYIGIIVGITAVLANHAIGVFVISTFNTDYILVKAKDMAKALEVLRTKGYSIVENETR